MPISLLINRLILRKQVKSGWGWATVGVGSRWAAIKATPRERDGALARSREKKILRLCKRGGHRVPGKMGRETEEERHVRKNRAWCIRGVWSEM